MIVCLCEGVSDRQIRAAVQAGACTIPELSRRCGAGRGCGQCAEDLYRLLRERGRAEPVAAK